MGFVLWLSSVYLKERLESAVFEKRKDSGSQRLFSLGIEVVENFNSTRQWVPNEYEKSESIEQSQRVTSPGCYYSMVIREAVAQIGPRLAKKSLRDLSRVGSVARSRSWCRSAVGQTCTDQWYRFVVAVDMIFGKGEGCTW